MTLDEFIEEEKKRLKRFRKWYRRMQQDQEEDPDLFPDEMDPGEWDENLHVFSE